MKINMDVLKELNNVTEEESNDAVEIAKMATHRMYGLRRFAVRQSVAYFLEQHAVEKGTEATVKAESFRIMAEAVYDEAQEMHRISDEYHERSINLKRELQKALAEVERLKATHMPNEDYIKLQSELNSFDTTHVPNKVYTKKLNENQELREQLTEAKSQVKILEAENEELKQSMQTEVEQVKATHIPNEVYTKRMREISKLKEQRTEAESWIAVLESEYDVLKRRIQELSKK